MRSASARRWCSGRIRRARPSRSSRKPSRPSKRGADRVGLAPDTLTFDCADPVAVATFWAAAMGYEVDPDSDQGGAFIGDPSRATRGMFFQPVPEPKTAKNRVHLDVRPSGTMQEEV